MQVKQLILIVEGNTQCRDSLRACFQSANYDVSVLYSPARLIKRISLERPSLIVLTSGNERGSGCLALRKLRDSGEGVPVVMLGERRDVDECIDALRTGADDFVFKPFDPREILARVRRVMARTVGSLRTEPPNRENFSFSGFVLDFTSHALTLQGRRIEINESDFALLNILSRAPGRLVTREAIARQLYPDQPIRTHTVSVMISRLRKLLRTYRNGPELIRTRWGHGYVFLPDYSK